MFAECSAACLRGVCYLFARCLQSVCYVFARCLLVALQGACSLLCVCLLSARQLLASCLSIVLHLLVAISDPLTPSGHCRRRPRITWSMELLMRKLHDSSITGWYTQKLGARRVHLALWSSQPNHSSLLHPNHLNRIDVDILAPSNDMHPRFKDAHCVSMLIVAAHISINTDLIRSFRSTRPGGIRWRYRASHLSVLGC